MSSSLPANGGLLKLLLSDNHIIDAKGQAIPVFIKEDSVSVGNYTTVTEQVYNRSGEISISIAPNPTHESSIASYTLTQPRAMRITLTDLLGRETVLVDKSMVQPGTYQQMIEAPSAGVYYLRLISGTEVIVKKLVRL